MWKVIAAVFSTGLIAYAVGKRRGAAEVVATPAPAPSPPPQPQAPPAARPAVPAVSNTVRKAPHLRAREAGKDLRGGNPRLADGGSGGGVAPAWTNGRVGRGGGFGYWGGANAGPRAGAQGRRPPAPAPPLPLQDAGTAVGAALPADTRYVLRRLQAAGGCRGWWRWRDEGGRESTSVGAPPSSLAAPHPRHPLLAHTYPPPFLHTHATPPPTLSTHLRPQAIPPTSSGARCGTSCWGPRPRTLTS